MKGLRRYSTRDILSLFSTRPGETKIGEKVKCLKEEENLEDNLARFVIFGIPEDVGVRANHGRAGTANAWKSFLSAFLNMQHNRFLDGERILLLGETEVTAEMRKASNIDVYDPNYHEKLGDIVQEIDLKVTEIIKAVVKSGKIPIIIGGGHNNAYGNIKGASLAFQRPIHALNIDAHTDLRTQEFRHSGNGFSYAMKEGFLGKYAIFGLHQNYTPEYIFKFMEKEEAIHFTLFEEILKGDPVSLFQKNLDFVKAEKFGLEVDCDAIANFPSSALAPSGFSLDQVREFIQEATKEKNCSYLHICEGVSRDNFATGKAMAFLVTEFLRSS